MQDGYRILESGKSGKMAKRYQHHKLPSCLGYPKHEGKDEENLTHFFGHYRLRQEFYQYRFQHCQFHQVMTVKTKLTLHPKLQASQELLAIAKILCHTDKDSFIGALTAWYEKWKEFINERAKGTDGKTHYVHKNTRSAYMSLKRNMPWLWTFYDFPELHMPNTNNELEALNSTLKAKLDLHKGISKERRKVFIQDFLKAHSPYR